MENDFKEINACCIVCGQINAIFFAKKNNCDLYRCGGCGLTFMWPMPKETAQVYSADYFSGAKDGFGYVDYDEDKSAMADTFISCLETIKEFSPNKGRLLDVGAATGYFLKKAGMLGWETVGVEISDYAAQKARATGLDVKTGTLENVQFEVGSFDAVTMWDVLEHLPNPKNELDKIYRLLKKGGILAINTPDAGSFFAKIMGKRWHLLVPPEHLVYFNPKNLTEVLKQSGFTVLKFNKIGKKFTVQYIIQTLSRWQNISIWNKILKYSNSIGVAKFHIPINLRDNFFIVAKKT